ncbi:hypothetical protein BLNAU_14746 [Blattamonas nauphoetae]|uniref:Uncharacterized protein n=1 Tax=Blattamonas nauphoetae TaxID=2049346 RepID=A0ABQ9XJJ6_9EUKA|nr:hypothetical protein BLNAU_14746 [Blattamonas nauphoetae]
MNRCIEALEHRVTNGLHLAIYRESRAHIFSSDTELEEKPTPSVPTTEELHSAIKALVRPKSEEDKKKLEFYLSLCDLLFESRSVPEAVRIVAVIDWLIGQLGVPSGRTKKQAEFIKGLIRKLMLIEPQRPKTNENAPKKKEKNKKTQKQMTAEDEAALQKQEKEERERVQEITNALFASAMPYALLPPDVS